MESILSSTSPNVGYVFEPDPKKRNVLTFTGKGEHATPIPFLLDSATLTFGRGVSFKYFLNQENAALLRGYGQGTLECSGLFGSMDDFKKIFGPRNACKFNTAELNVLSVATCPSEGGTGQSGDQEFYMSGITPTRIQISATVDQSGIYYCTANASFQFTGLNVL